MAILSPYSFTHSFTHPLTHSITHLQAAAPSTAYPRAIVCTTEYLYIKSTTVYVPSSELGPNPSLAVASVPLTPEPGGGTTCQGVRGWGSPNSDDWRKSLAFCLLCGVYPHVNLNAVQFPPTR
jgi:hypothetical protein